jgi:hypothetical protein
MERVYREEFAIAWLIVLHVLADVTLGVLRTHNAEWLATDFLSAALPRGQIALLAIWLALGETRLSWRICGFIAGGFFIFSLLTRTTWPAQFGIGANAIWMDEEWGYYFRTFESGDYLVKAPLIAVGIIIPLAAMRWREILAAITSRPIRELFRFRFADAAMWVVTISVVLVGVFQTSPHPEWFEHLFEHWRQAYRLSDRSNTLAVTSSGLYVMTAFVSLWGVFSKTSPYLRVFVWGAMLLGPNLLFDIFLQHPIDRAPTDRFDIWLRVPETISCVIAAVVIVVSLLFVKLYRSLILAANAG